MVGMTKHCAKKDGGELLWRGQDREGGREGELTMQSGTKVMAKVLYRWWGR
jgi:hypothetical protein